MRHHLIVSGTGRAGTTFLIQLMTKLGLDTGYSDPFSAISPDCDAGMERDIREYDAPYIVKSPWLCDYLGEVLESGEVAIDRAIVPVRDLYSAAESRRDVTRRAGISMHGELESVPGGLSHTHRPEEQEMVLAAQLYKLIHVLAQYDIPMTLCLFPRLVKDPEYLYQKIGDTLGGVNHATFLEAFRAVSRPELVHDYQMQKMGE